MNSLFQDLLCLLLEFRFVYFCFSVLFSDLFTSRIPLSLLELLTQFAGFPTVCLIYLLQRQRRLQDQCLHLRDLSLQVPKKITIENEVFGFSNKHLQKKYRATEKDKQTRLCIRHVRFS